LANKAYVASWASSVLSTLVSWPASSYYLVSLASTPVDSPVTLVFQSVPIV
jgi:hypothetical protein